MRFDKGGGVNPGIAGLKNEMIKRRMGSGLAPGMSADQVYQQAMETLKKGSEFNVQGPMSSENPEVLQRDIEEFQAVRSSDDRFRDPVWPRRHLIQESCGTSSTAGS